MKYDGARKQVSDVWSHCSLVIPPTSPGLLIAPEWVFYHQTHPYPWHPKLCLTFSPCPGKVITTPSAPVWPPAGTESITDAYACSTASHRGPRGPAPSWQGHGVFSGQPHWSKLSRSSNPSPSVSWHRGYNPMGHHPLGIWAEGFPHLNWGLECDLAVNGTVDLAASSHEPGPK